MGIKDNKGFTISELLIVVAIIIILAAIAIQEFNRYRARGIATTLNSDAIKYIQGLLSLFRRQSFNNYMLCSGRCIIRIFAI